MKKRKRNLTTGDFLDAKDGLRNVDGFEDVVDLLVQVLQLLLLLFTALPITTRRRLHLLQQVNLSLCICVRFHRI